MQNQAELKSQGREGEGKCWYLMQDLYVLISTTLSLNQAPINSMAVESTLNTLVMSSIPLRPIQSRVCHFMSPRLLRYWYSRHRKKKGGEHLQIRTTFANLPNQTAKLVGVDFFQV